MEKLLNPCYNTQKNYPYTQESSDTMDKQLNFVLISPHFPANYETFAHRLHENGIRTLGIGDAPYETLTDGLRHALSEYYRVNDMNDYDQMYRAVAYFAHKYGKIDRIESHNEYWLEMDARLRTDFNVFGFKNADMERIKTKSKMKEVFKQYGIPVAKGRVFTDDADARQLAAELGFPIVIKPNNGVGASDTYKISSVEELEAFFGKRNPAVSYIMEEFIPGEIVTFDGLTDRDGNIVFYSTIVHSATLLDIVGNDQDMFYFLPREIPNDLLALGTQCVEAFGIKERFFHFEFFRTEPKGELMALEINCRPPGGLTIDMFNYANELDIFNEYAHIVKDNHFNAALTRPYHCLYVSRKSHSHYVHDEDAIRQQYAPELVSIQSVPGVFSSIMGDIGFIFKTPHREQLQEIINFVRAKY